MNAYDVRYEIRLANKSDIDSIMKFIDKYWKKNHIMSRNRELFEYEFLEDDGTVNFLLAIDRKNGLIQALLPCTHRHPRIQVILQESRYVES